MALNRGRVSRSMGSGKGIARMSSVPHLRTVNPQSNFTSRITTLKAVGPGGRISAKIPRY